MGDSYPLLLTSSFPLIQFCLPFTCPIPRTALPFPKKVLGWYESWVDVCVRALATSVSLQLQLYFDLSVSVNTFVLSNQISYKMKQWKSKILVSSFSSEKISAFSWKWILVGDHWIWQVNKTDANCVIQTVQLSWQACWQFLTDGPPCIITTDYGPAKLQDSIRFDFKSNFRFGIRFVVMIRFEIFESSAPSIVLCKETIGGG